MSDAQNRLVISLDDLATPSVEARVAELRAAAVPQTVRTVGSPTDAGARRWWRGGIASSAASGLLGGVAGWVISEVLTRPDSPGGPFADDPGLATALFLALFATGLATVMAGWEGIQLRSVRKAMPALARAVPLALIVGAFVGYLVQVVIYEPIIESALRRALAEQSAAASDAVLMNGVRIGRAIGFMVAGSALGLALGAASRSGKRAVNGLLGGAVGGFVGGFMGRSPTTPAWRRRCSSRFSRVRQVARGPRPCGRLRWLLARTDDRPGRMAGWSCPGRDRGRGGGGVLAVHGGRGRERGC